MQKGVLSHRVHYEQSGRIGWEFFGLVIPVTAGAAILLALVLSLALHLGLYFAAYAACGAAIPLCALGWWGVRAGRCRNALVAGLYGVLAGAAMYFSYYYLDLIASNGFRKFETPQALIAHIEFRLQHNRWQKVGHQDAPEPITAVNAFVFGAELFLVTVISAIGPVRMSRNVYCERARSWAKRQLLALPTGSAHFLFDLVDRGFGEECPARFKSVAVNRGDPFCEVVLESCPAPSSESDGDTYLSVREIDAAAPYQHHCREGFVVRQCRLSTQELQELRSRFAPTAPL